ncbi:uncharacterized protein LOC126665438 [Mercurialis annua]|uniref:uncharacterized protein LOC126656603 n=1 Tax=Mercurialis annua TaxID=3986 RepID=UPI002160E0EC|nr:uncharacterized protein LOC126656603 [Mercurialis annua]XP_050214217.1 uncharacterized protein LOC126665438 [Mercurialis annua]
MSTMTESFRALQNVTDELFNLPPTRECGRCNHGRLLLYTSWTKTNPGRRFWRCSKSRTPQDCGAFRWYDGEVPCELNMKFTILLDKIKVLKDEAAVYDNQIIEMANRIKRLEAAQEKAAIAFAHIQDQNDRLLKENQELQMKTDGSQTCSWFCKKALMVLLCIYVLFCYVM